MYRFWIERKGRYRPDDDRPRLRSTRLRLLACAIVVGVMLVSSSATAGAVESGHRLSGDEGRANISATDPGDPCLIHQIWLSALVGDAMPLGTGDEPSAVSRVYASNDVFDICTGETVEFFEGEVALEPQDVEFERLKSFSIHNITVELNSEASNVQSLTFDLTWTSKSEGNTFIDNVGGTGAFQVERFVMADVTGSAVMNGNFNLSGEPWSGEISHLTQVGRPTPTGTPASHPDLEGTWTTTDCAQWWEDGRVDCSIWGDESTLSLVISPGNTPALTLYDTYSRECDVSGLDTTFKATGTGEYVQDGIWVTFDMTWCGGTPAPWIGSPLNEFVYYDPGSDSLWGGDPDGDGWGYNLHRAETLSWNPATDWHDSPNQMNPSPDQYGNPAVWSYMASESLARDPGTYELLPDYNPVGEQWYDAEYVNLLVGHDFPGSVTLRMHSYGGRIIDFVKKSIISWTSPVDGTVIIKGEVWMVSLDECGSGDGILWSIDRGDTLLYGSAVSAGEARSFELTLAVSAGETFYFTHDPGWDSNCDTAFISLDIATP